MNLYTPQELRDLPNGTPVLVIKDYNTFSVGAVVYRKHHQYDDKASCKFSERKDGGGDSWLMTATEVAKIPDAPIVAPVDDVYRPDVTTRKEGKVRVELVDDGFPLALREIAKVMTWAQTAKGYKDHDWQNLPNAEVQLAAAASRHRTDHIKQRIVDGENIVDCVDGESKLLHKAHEAFGVLAQLELMLRGEFE